MKATIQHYQSLSLLYSLAVSSTTLTCDTAFPVNRNYRTKRRRLYIIRTMKFHTCIWWPILKCIILKRTLTALIAYRAVKRMVEKGKLQNPFLSFLNLISYCVDNHIGSHVHSTGGHQLRHFFDLNKTHTAAT